MLVLSRQRDETIMIGDEIEISVVDIRGDKVRIGINAPTRIAVHRKEVYDAIRAENTQASRLDATDLDSIAQTVTRGPARAGARTTKEPARSLAATHVSAPPGGAGTDRPRHADPDRNRDTA